MYIKKPNPIAEQSRQWLIDALLTLMEKKEYTSITISEIAKQADLSRMTFYRIFNTKEEILEQYFFQLCDEYMACFEQRREYKLKEIFTIFFSFWEERIPFLHLMEKNHLLHYLLEKFNQLLPVIHNTVNLNSVAYKSQFEMKIALLVSVGALWNIIPTWIALTERPAPDEMVELMLHAIQSNL